MENDTVEKLWLSFCTKTEKVVPGCKEKLQNSFKR